MNRAIIGIGSNIQPERHVEAALAEIAAHHRILRQSQFVRTPAIARPEQPDYLNGAVLIETELDLEWLRMDLQEIESRLGRVRTDDKYAARTMDLDVLTWNDAVIHPDAEARDFVRESVRELMAKTPP